MSSIKQTLVKKSLVTHRRRGLIIGAVAVLVLAGAATGLQAFIGSVHALDEWSETSVAGAEDRFYNHVDQSSDGSHAIASGAGNNGNGNLFTTSDSGVTWTEQKAAGNRNWGAVAISPDGTKMVAAEKYGYVYTSTNGGVTWTERTASDAASWSYIAISTNGMNITAGGESGLLASSQDGGQTWTRFTAIGSHQWTAVAMSGDGQTQIASAYAYYDPDLGYIQGSQSYQSLDGGVSWQAITSLGSSPWAGADITTDGQTAIIANGDYLYTSHDGMQTWDAGQDIQSFNLSFAKLQISDDANTIMLVSGLSKHISSDAGENWNTFTVTGQGYPSDISLSADGMSMIATPERLGSFNISHDLGQTWSQVATSGARFWHDITKTDDGQYQAAVASGYIYTSSNGGTSWTQRTGAGTHEWGFITYSGNGSVLIAGVGGDYDSGFVYISQDHGVTWTQVDESVTGRMRAAAISQNGSIIIVGTNDGVLFRSMNAGVDWQTLTNPSMSNLHSIAMSNDGQNVLAASINHPMVLSSNAGSSWTTQTAAGSKQWESVAMSGNGQKLVALETNSHIYVSTNGGAWAEASGSPESVNYKDVAISDDGSRIIAVGGYGGIYSSLDGGTLWTQRTNTPNLNWRAVAVDADGGTVSAVGYSSEIWSGALQVPTAPYAISSLTIDTITSDSFHLSWTAQTVGTPVDTYELQYRVKGTATWTGAESISGSQHSYTLSGLEASTQYEVRLRAVNGIGASAWLSGMYQTHTLPFSFSDPALPSDVASSQDGVTLLAAPDDGHLYITHNSGTDWTVIPGIVSDGWSAVGISGDGSKMMAADVTSGSIYVSENAGADWTESTSAGSDQWVSVAISNDGSTMYAVGMSGGVIKSTDGGQSWPVIKANGGGELNYALSIAPNDDLFLTVLGFSGSSTLLKSVDGGTTWEPLHDVADTYPIWVGAGGADAHAIYLATSVDGTTLDPEMMKSEDGGTTWEPVSLNATPPLALSGDGEHLFYLFNGDLISYEPSITVTTLAAGEDPDDNQPPIVVTPPANGDHSSGSPTASNGSGSGSSTKPPLTLKIDNLDAQGGQTISKHPTFSGYASPFAQVIVTVHSDPKECRTTADETGYWTCTLAEDLEPGTHTVRVSVVNTDGSIQESDPYQVTVEGATDVKTASPETQTGTIDTKNQGWPLLWYVVGGAAVLLVVILIATAIAKRRG